MQGNEAERWREVYFEAQSPVSSPVLVPVPVGKDLLRQRVKGLSLGDSEYRVVKVRVTVENVLGGECVDLQLALGFNLDLNFFAKYGLAVEDLSVADQSVGGCEWQKPLHAISSFLRRSDLDVDIG